MGREEAGHGEHGYAGRSNAERCDECPKHTWHGQGLRGAWSGPGSAHVCELQSTSPGAGAGFGTPGVSAVRADARHTCLDF